MRAPSDCGRHGGGTRAGGYAHRRRRRQGCEHRATAGGTAAGHGQAATRTGWREPGRVRTRPGRQTGGRLPFGRPSAAPRQRPPRLTARDAAHPQRPPPAEHEPTERGTTTGRTQARRRTASQTTTPPSTSRLNAARRRDERRRDGAQQPDRRRRRQCAWVG